MYKPLTLICAAAVVAPALWLAFVDQSLPTQTALTRYLIAVPVCGVVLAIFRSIVADYGRERAEPDHPMRRAGDGGSPLTTVDGEVVRPPARTGASSGPDAALGANPARVVRSGHVGGEVERVRQP